jgi:hypothetical protein
MIATTKRKKIVNDLICPHDGFGNAYLTGVFTGSDFEMTTILHVFQLFCEYGIGCFALAWPNRLDLNT